MLNAIGNLTL